MATTAIGTLIPILRDNGELKTKFGTYLLAAGRSRRVRPDPAGHALPLHRPPAARGGDPDRLHRCWRSPWRSSRCACAWRGWPALERTFEASSQLAVRITVVLVFGLVLLASKLGLDVLLGGFVAGMITRLALKGHELQVFESKLTAVGFGFFVPFFFVTSGIDFDLDGARLGRPRSLKLAMFFGLFLVVRGAPALLLYRGVLSARDRAALAFYSATELPARRRDHDDRDQGRPHENLDRGRPGRRRDALDPRLPLRRPGPAQARERGERGAPAASPSPPEDRPAPL